MAVTDLQRIEDKIDRAAAGAIAVSDSIGGIAFSNMSEVLEFAKLMSIAGTAVPKHLRGNPGQCLAVTIQALEWRSSPFAVANKSYEVNDRIAYESQLIHAVIEARAPITQRLRPRYEGKVEDGSRQCFIDAQIKGEATPLPPYESPRLDKIRVKNSPLWKDDPDQQLFYYSSRAWARRFCPDVLLGIYTEDELKQSGGTADGAVDITPQPSVGARLGGRKRNARGFSEAKVAEAIDTTAETVPEETARQKGDRLLAACATPEDVFDLSAAISEELAPDDRPAWLEACDARKAALEQQKAA